MRAKLRMAHCVAEPTCALTAETVAQIPAEVEASSARSAGLQLSIKQEVENREAEKYGVHMRRSKTHGRDQGYREDNSRYH